MDVYEMITHIESKDDFISFIGQLSKDNPVSHDEWYNVDIPSYLEAVSSWVEDMDGYYENLHLTPPANIDWEFIATLFYVGKIYE